jgi:hypothetical protein
MKKIALITCSLFVLVSNLAFSQKIDPAQIANKMQWFADAKTGNFHT